MRLTWRLKASSNVLTNRVKTVFATCNKSVYSLGAYIKDQKRNMIRHMSHGKEEEENVGVQGKLIIRELFC